MNTKTTLTIGSRYQLNGDLYEVISYDHDRYLLRSINHKGSVYLKDCILESILRSGNLKKIHDALPDATDSHCLIAMSSEERRTFDNNLFYVREVTKKFHGSLPRGKINSTIAELAKLRQDEFPPKYTKLYNLVRKYRESNSNIFSIAKVKGVKKSRTKRIGEEQFEVMDDYIRNYYLTSEMPTGKQTYSLFVGHIEELNRNSFQKLEIPSLGSLYRRIQSIPVYTLDVARLGSRAANKKNGYSRGILIPDRLLERAEADSQEMDIVVVNPEGGPTDRPWLTAIIEAKTGVLLGWIISLNPPCYEMTAIAIRRAIQQHNDGTSAGLFEELIVDNGSEFYNSSLIALANRLGFEVRFCTKGEPNQKPFIESFFNTLNKQFIHSLRGTTKSNPAARGNYDSYKNAIYTVEELREKFEYWIHNVYHNTIHGE
jgi:putative transposase